MELFAKTEQEYFLKEIGRKLLDTKMFGSQALENEKEQEFYLNLKNPKISIPILEGYREKAEELVFDDDVQLGDDYKKSRSAKEAVRALSLIRKISIIRRISEAEGKKDLINKINAEIISIGDRVNKFRPEYALEGTRYGIDFSAVPFAYNSADGTIERRLETAEKIIENQDYISNLSKNIIDLYSSIGTRYAQRIAKKLSGQYLKPIESFESKHEYKESIERVLEITRKLYDKKENLFKKMEKFLDRELLARVKYPKSRIAKSEGKVIVIQKDGEKIITINDKEKEIATKPA